MLKNVLAYGVVCTLGTVLGLYATVSLLKYQIESTSVKHGAWSYNPHVGSETASGLTRAAVALIGFLGMTKEESMYFMAIHDDDGNPLVGNCTYTIEGDIPRDASRWWSITVYDTNTDKLIKTDTNRYSYNRHNIRYSEDSKFSITVSSKQHGGNWLPVLDNIDIDLTLRLYNPNPSIILSPLDMKMPTIKRGECA